MASRRHVIADDLRTQISSGRFKAGERLPSEAQLAARYAVSTPTLRNALALLQGEGVVEKVHGRGNFVRHPIRRITYFGGGHTPDAKTATDAALRMSVRTTHLPARGDLTALLRVSVSSPLTEFLCISHAGKSPHSLARIYVPRDLAPADDPNGYTSCKEVWARLVELRPPLAEVQERVNARFPTPREAATLRISSALPVLAVTRVATDATGRVVEAARLVLPSDRADALFTHHTMSGDRRTEG
ncbi:GntR family transcriptional regulator [Streptomyces sp. NPDC052179]|uniref:GntR family transcriptional regulator n=1 Tax=Streptomyces sp. NPDC052179 TaxID=3155680 RepID=UPI003447C9AC